MHRRLRAQIPDLFDHFPPAVEGARDVLMAPNPKHGARLHAMATGRWRGRIELWEVTGAGWQQGAWVSIPGGGGACPGGARVASKVVWGVQSECDRVCVPRWAVQTFSRLRCISFSLSLAMASDSFFKSCSTREVLGTPEEGVRVCTRRGHPEPMWRADGSVACVTRTVRAVWAEAVWVAEAALRAVWAAAVRAVWAAAVRAVWAEAELCGLCGLRGGVVTSGATRRWCWPAPRHR